MWGIPLKCHISKGLTHTGSWYCQGGVSTATTFFKNLFRNGFGHCNNVIMSAVASQITSVSTVCTNFGSGTDQRKHQSSASLAFVWGIHRWPINIPHKRPVTRKMFWFDDVIVLYSLDLFAIQIYVLCGVWSRRGFAPPLVYRTSFGYAPFCCWMPLFCFLG